MVEEEGDVADYTDTLGLDARQIVENLLRAEQPSMDMDDRVSIVDLARDAAEFAADIELLEEMGMEAPVVRVGEDAAVPVALSLIAGPRWPSIGREIGSRWRSHPLLSALSHQYLRSVLETRERFGSFETLPTGIARATFVMRAADFLTVRMKAVREFDGFPSQTWHGNSFLHIPQRPRGPVIATPGCRFTVTTDSPGLRVFWSGAYWVTSNYFGHPTTPTDGVLQAGTYVFGVDGGAYGNEIQWDFNAVVALPGRPHMHMNY